MGFEDKVTSKYQVLLDKDYSWVNPFGLPQQAHYHQIQREFRRMQWMEGRRHSRGICAPQYVKPTYFKTRLGTPASSMLASVILPGEAALLRAEGMSALSGRGGDLTEWWGPCPCQIVGSSLAIDASDGQSVSIGSIL
jgi:hypothetical protein